MNKENNFRELLVKAEGLTLVSIDKSGLKKTHTSMSEVVERLNKLGYNVEESGASIKLSAQDYGFREIYQLKERLKETIISGIKGIEQILIVKRGKDFVVVALGTNLKEIIKLKEVDKNSNEKT